MASALDEMPGIGLAKKRILLRHYGSVRKLKAVSQAELAKLLGGKLAAKLKAVL